MQRSSNVRLAPTPVHRIALGADTANVLVLITVLNAVVSSAWNRHWYVTNRTLNILISDTYIQCSHTQRGRSWAKHVRDREADIERAKNWRLVHLRRSRGEARRADTTFELCFRAKAAKKGEWRGPKVVVVLWRKEDRRAEPVFGGVWSKTPNSSPRRLAIGCFQRNQYVTLSSSVLFRTIAFQQTVLTPSRALILCALALKSLKWLISRKPEVEIWRKHVQSIFWPWFPIRLL